MTEIHEPDLSSIKPVDDMEASSYLSAETHRWLRESVVIDDRVGQVGLTAIGERLQPPRHAVRQHGGRRRDIYTRGTLRRVLLATLLLVTVAALSVLLPGLLSDDGSVTQPPSAQAQILHRITAALARGPETILIQEMRMRVVTTQPGAAPRTPFGPVTSLTIDEASQDGAVQRSFSTSSELRPGFEQLSAGNSLQVYDPSNDTIYETTLAAWKAAVQRREDQTLQKGSHGTSFSFTYSGRDSTGPGQLSVFEQRLRQHLYRLGGRTSVDGRPALELVPVRTSIKVSSSGGNGSAREFLGTVYVSPTTYYPIKEVTRISSTGSPFGSGPGSVTTIVNGWSEYKVLPATTKNAGLLSLTARHPHAQVVHGAEAYLRVSDNASHH
jgi:hypothetical protein